MPGWVGDASCMLVAADEWFPEHDPGAMAMAKRICRRCDVRAECLELALSMPEPPEGIWGGTTEAERRRLRRGAA